MGSQRQEVRPVRHWESLNPRVLLCSPPWVSRGDSPQSDDDGDDDPDGDAQVPKSQDVAPRRGTKKMAGVTGLEPATSGLTGRRA